TCASKKRGSHACNSRANAHGGGNEPKRIQMNRHQLHLENRGGAMAEAEWQWRRSGRLLVVVSQCCNYL
uniref:Uncharacterized protein n=1 Tax=Triticum urartu TaxID=4572 RepID=A0A8R7P810_TRIUA